MIHSPTSITISGVKESHPQLPKFGMLDNCRDSFPLAEHNSASVLDSNFVEGIVVHSKDCHKLEGWKTAIRV